MAESVKEAEPETRPRGQRRGLDRLRASGEGTGNGEGMADPGQPNGADPHDGTSGGPGRRKRQRRR